MLYARAWEELHALEECQTCGLSKQVVALHKQEAERQLEEARYRDDDTQVWFRYLRVEVIHACSVVQFQGLTVPVE